MAKCDNCFIYFVIHVNNEINKTISISMDKMVVDSSHNKMTTIPEAKKTFLIIIIMYFQNNSSALIILKFSRGDF